MKHIIQPRGPGTAYRFKMRTPTALRGMIDPVTKVPFGSSIGRSLGGTSHLPTAKRLRDIRLAEVRAMEASASESGELGNRFSLEMASEWAQALRVQRAAGGPDEGEPDILDLIQDEEARAPKSQRARFRRVALSGTMSIADAVTRYLHDRRPGNGNGNAEMVPTSQNDLRLAARYLCAFMATKADAELDESSVFLEDVTRDVAAEFRGDYLPSLTSPRSPSGLSLGTVEKHVSFLRGLWDWALGKRLAGSVDANPFDAPKGVRKRARDRTAKRDMFSPMEAGAVMRAYGRGHRLGDVFRLSLLTETRGRLCCMDRVKVSDPLSPGTVSRQAA